MPRVETEAERAEEIAINQRFMANYRMIPLKANHADLKPWSPHSRFRRCCPRCGEGPLLVYRNKETMVLEPDDHCLSCGRRIVYQDIEALRLFDEGKSPYPKAQGRGISPIG